MSIHIRPPHITNGSEAEQIKQIRSYLFQLAEQLNFALIDLYKKQSSDSSQENSN